MLYGYIVILFLEAIIKLNTGICDGNIILLIQRPFNCNEKKTMYTILYLSTCKLYNIWLLYYYDNNNNGIWIYVQYVCIKL